MLVGCSPHRAKQSPRLTSRTTTKSAYRSFEMDLRRYFEHLSYLFFGQFLESFIGLTFLDFHLLDLTQPKTAASDSVSLLSGALSTML